MGDQARGGQFYKRAVDAWGRCYEILDLYAHDSYQAKNYRKRLAWHQRKCERIARLVVKERLVK